MRYIQPPVSVYRKYEEIENRKHTETKSTETPNTEDWKFEVGVDKEIEIAGRKMKMKGDDGNIYAGEIVRQMFESRKWRPESYTWMGYTKDPNRGVEEVGIPHQSLFTHTAIFGKSGVGKSTVIQNLLFQWISAGWGVCFIDPKGDDSPELLQSIPEHRMDDVIWCEPGTTEKEATIGFNFFDTRNNVSSEEREKEAKQLTTSFVEILKEDLQGGHGGSDWVPKLGGISRAIVSQLALADEDYTIIDFYRVLKSESERQAFLDMYGNNLDDIEREYIENLNPQDNDIRSLISKVQEMSSTHVVRETLADDRSDISISEVVEEGKVLIMNTSNLEDEQKIISSSIVRRIWSTVQARSDKPMDERTPFFLCIDEFDDVAQNMDDEPDYLKIQKIISKARSLRLSVLLSNQQPRQLSESVREAAYACDNLFTFNPGEHSDAHDLTQGIGDIDARQLLDLGRYRLLGKLTIDNSKTDPLLIHNFPKYPPLHTEEEAEELVRKSRSRYGTEQSETSTDMSEYGVVRYQADRETEPVRHNGYKITPRHAIASIIAESAVEDIEIEDKGNWVSDDAVQTAFRRHFDGVNYSKLKGDIIRPTLDQFIERTELNGVEYLRATEEGWEHINPERKGEEYGRLTRKSLQFLSDIGYLLMFPPLEREQYYFQGEAAPPIDPTGDATTMNEAKSLYRALKQSYPEISDLFGDKKISIRPTVNPYKTVDGVVKSLAISGDKICLYVVNDQKLENGLKPAQAIDEILNKEPKLCREERRGIREFYTTDNNITLENGGIPVHTGSGTIWEESENKTLVARDYNGNELVEVDDFKEIDDGMSTDSVSMYITKKDLDDEDSNSVVLIDTSGDESEEFSSIEGALDKYNPIKKPFIPEEVFEDPSILPDTDEWGILVIPTDESEEPYFTAID